MQPQLFRACFCFCAGLLLLWLAGCKPAYVPNRQHVPLLNKQGEFSLNLNPRNLQLAYSPVPHLGLMANGFYRAAKGRMPDYTDNQFEDERFRTFLSLAEGAAGFYYPLSADSAFVFDLYAGFGAGEVNVNIVEEDVHQTTGQRHYTYRRFTARQERAFAQPAIGYRTNDLAVVLSARVSSVRFANRGYQNLGFNAAYYYGLHTMERRHVLLEPALTVRGGSRNLKAEIQFSFINLLTPEKPLEKVTYVHSRPAINFSLHVALGNKARNKVPVLR